MAKILKIKLHEDYRIKRKTSGVYVIVNDKTGEEHHAQYFDIKAARRKKRQFESGGIPKRLKESEISGNHTGEAIAGFDPLLQNRKKINNKEKRYNSRGKTLLVRRKPSI